MDGRIDLAQVLNETNRERVAAWLAEAAAHIGLPAELTSQLKGVVFEVRQGYKSKDSKRQNADIANASNAYVHSYMPALVLFSTQIDDDVGYRYIQARWLLLRGTMSGTATTSTYAFCRDVLGYDLAGFFQRNSPRLKTEIESILATLMEA